MFLFDYLKIAALQPFYKKLDKTCITNYRPITLLTDSYKVFESIIHSRLALFLFLWRCGPTRAMASLIKRFLDHKQRRTTV